MLPRLVVLLTMSAAAGLQQVGDESTGGALVALSASGEGESLGGPLPLDADGLLKLDVALVLADGLLLPVARRGAAPPVSFDCLLTTSRAGQAEVDVVVVAAARPTAGGSRELARATRVVDGGVKGRAQLAVQVQVRARFLRIRVGDVAAPDAKPTVATAAAAPDAVDERLRFDALPDRWRCDVGAPHSHFYFNGVAIRLDQRTSRGDAPLGREGDVDASYTASRVWPAAYELAAHLEAEGTVRGVNVLELGAGTGLAGLAAAKALGASAVTLTDLSENLPLLERNVALPPRSAAPIRAVALDWLAPDLPPDLGAYDVVIVADCVFWPSLFDPLLDTIARLRAARPHARVLFSVTHRLDRTALFFERLTARGWAAPAAKRPDRPRAQNTDVYELAPFADGPPPPLFSA